MNTYEITGTATVAGKHGGKQTVKMDKVVVTAKDEPAAIHAALEQALENGRVADIDNIIWFRPATATLLPDQPESPAPAAGVTKLDPHQVRADGGTQARAGLDEATVDEYAAAMSDGATFPPIVVFYDGTDYWLGDGFHRIAAHKRARSFPGMPGKFDPIEAEVKAGTRRDAVLYAAGANASHGLRRTNADKQRAVTVLLEDEEWGKWSDREIARRCGVSDRMVNKMRATLPPSANNSQIAAERTVERNGQTYTMNTAGIGKATPVKAEFTAPAAPANTTIRPTPPDGYLPLHRWNHKCPVCKGDGFVWNGSGWQDEEALELQRQVKKLDDAWFANGRQGPRPDGNSPEFLALRDHWSRFATGNCLGCNCRFWNDFVGTWQYYYKPPAAKNEPAAQEQKPPAMPAPIPPTPVAPRAVTLPDSAYKAVSASLHVHPKAGAELERVFFHQFRPFVAVAMTSSGDHDTFHAYELIEAGLYDGPTGPLYQGLPVCYASHDYRLGNPHDFSLPAPAELDPLDVLAEKLAALSAHTRARLAHHFDLLSGSSLVENDPPAAEFLKAIVGVLKEAEDAT